MKASLSVIVLTHNDEMRIVDCLESVDFAEEIIIIDDNSSDRTMELARQYTEKIYSHPLSGNFASQRNFALNKAHFDWVLYVDSDELVNGRLREEIIKAIKMEDVSGYFMKRVDVMWGKRMQYGEAGGISLLRLAKRNSGKWHGKVHEVWKTRGKTRQLHSPLIHIPHQSVSEFVREIDIYSSLRADELYESKVSSTGISIVVYPVAKFFVNYFLKKGYKDGVPGLLYAMLMSFHSFLVRGKLLLKNNG